MVIFYKKNSIYYAVETTVGLNAEDHKKLTWLFSNAEFLPDQKIEGTFTGPRREMITPWSTNAVEITQNMGIRGITRIEEFSIQDKSKPFDPMLQAVYAGLDQHIFRIAHQADPVFHIEDIAAYNLAQGLALSKDEISYLENLAKKTGRLLTDSEVFGFSQVNSEHCRHKIFNGIFIIDGKEMPETLFDLIRKTSKNNPRLLVSAYKDNVAFIQGPAIEQFAPLNQDRPDDFVIIDIDSVISLKAETHNFPTTVEPFNGAATGSGGEIRDRMAGGKGSIPLAGTAVYMTSYPRNDEERTWEKNIQERKWLYKNPEEILIKASNGASDFGNKFGQALICGSVLTFEHSEDGKTFGFDKVIMLAGGIGFAKAADSLKDHPTGGEKVIILGGDNYRIGMGGGAVSSVATGEYENAIELNAVQRSNPEMQKRVFNAIRALCEAPHNPVISIHDHGAGGHLNSISELIEDTGGVVHIDKLPVGDPTLSDREIISNESQERMGMVMKPEDAELLAKIADRERAPMYVTGETTGDHKLVFENAKSNSHPVDLTIEDFFGKPPKTIIYDTTCRNISDEINYDTEKLNEYLESVLRLEAVACKDWLTNKVDRAVSGKIALQQTCGPVQLPLNNCGVTALDYRGEKGIATSLGHAPAAGLIDPAAGSELSIAESLTNIIWAPLTHGLDGISLSANWMWPCKNKGEDARLYKAVEAAGNFSTALGINIPTGKDSLSMTQKYPDGKVVYSPGTVIISAVGEVSDVKKCVTPVLKNEEDTVLCYINFGSNGFELGGSSFAQILNRIGHETPKPAAPADFGKKFTALQELIEQGKILAGHDVSAGGLITTLLEMTFPLTEKGIHAEFDVFGESDIVKLLFSENPGVIIQVKNQGWKTGEKISLNGAEALVIGNVTKERIIDISLHGKKYLFEIDKLRDKWFRTSYLLDRKQSGEKLALDRFENYKNQPLQYKFRNDFEGRTSALSIDPLRRKPSGIRAAIIREKGVNRDRDMANALYLAGFDVKDVHMTDLISGRETLEDVNMIAFVGGFSNSDVLGSAKGWAGAFLYNEKARQTLENFFRRDDTLSLGVCNGCQLLVELGLIYPEMKNDHPHMSWNDSQKYECTFVSVDIVPNNSVMLGSLAGSTLGIWVAHGEGKFNFSLNEEKYHIPAKFRYHGYPGNPNGSGFDAACIASHDGRHLAIMPHLEDSVLPWQWAYYPEERKADEVTPWAEAFVNAREWIRKKISK